MLSHSILAGLVLGSVLIQTPIKLHKDEDIERDFHSQAEVLAVGKWDADTKTPRAPWPVHVLSIGHTMASYQNYGMVASAYFHHGLDIRADAGSEVIASRGGKVVNIENYEPGQKEYWEILILDDDGFLWQYHHIDPNSIPAEIHAAYKSGNKIADGTKIGEVVYWPVVSYGERYHHVHLNILGSGKTYLNPFAFLEPLKDTVGPEVASIYLVQNGKKVSGTTVSGTYTIGAEVRDWILSDVFINPPNEIKYSVDGGPMQTMWKFDKLPGGASNTEFVNKFYIPGLACGDYSCRRPVVDLGFKTTRAQVFPIAKGNHDLRIEVSDFENNQATKTYSWTVK